MTLSALTIPLYAPVPSSLEVLCSRFMKVCGGGAFTMADDTICEESHNTCNSFMVVVVGVVRSMADDEI
jgi:hypothetical protein